MVHRSSPQCAPCDITLTPTLPLGAHRDVHHATPQHHHLLRIRATQLHFRLRHGGVSIFSNPYVSMLATGCVYVGDWLCRHCWRLAVSHFSLPLIARLLSVDGSTLSSASSETSWTTIPSTPSSKYTLATRWPAFPSLLPLSCGGDSVVTVGDWLCRHCWRLAVSSLL